MRSKHIAATVASQRFETDWRRGKRRQEIFVCLKKMFSHTRFIVGKMQHFMQFVFFKLVTPINTRRELAASERTGAIGTRTSSEWRWGTQGRTIRLCTRCAPEYRMPTSMTHRNHDCSHTPSKTSLKSRKERYIRQLFVDKCHLPIPDHGAALAQATKPAKQELPFLLLQIAFANSSEDEIKESCK